MATNYQILNENVKSAKNGVKTAKKNIMYYVNVLNKLYRKNEFCNNVDLQPLGKQVRAKALELGFEVSTSSPFNAYLFFRGVNGVSGYTKTHKVRKNGYFAVDTIVTDFVPVKLSENGLINAYKDILGVDAKEADRKAKDAAKLARKAKDAAKADARKQLKKEQKEARISFNSGKMCAEEFASIMAKAI